MILSPSGIPSIDPLDGSTRLNYAYIGGDASQYDSQFSETIKSFASAALSTMVPRAITNSGFTSSGFFLEYLPFASAPIGARLKTQALSLMEDVGQLKTLYVVPYIEYNADVMSDLAGFAVKVGSGLKKGIENISGMFTWLVVLAVGVFAFSAAPKITIEKAKGEKEKI